MSQFTRIKMIWQGIIKRFSKMEKRFVIIHNHIFKNAGTTIDWALHRNFGNGFVDHRDDKNMQRGSEYLGPYLLDNPNIRALSTHHLRHPLPLLEKAEFMTIMMFRHPIERVTSVYNFERKQTQADTLGARFARDHNLREYVLWRMRSDVPPTIRNFHIFRTLPGTVNWQQDIGDAEFMRAKTYVDSLNMIGFVECFDESMILFEKSLATVFPGIDLSYKTQNIGQKAIEPRELRIERLHEEIGDSAFEYLAQKNRYDIGLYDYAKSLFDRRLLHITTLKTEIELFRKRCRNHSGKDGIKKPNHFLMRETNSTNPVKE